MHLNQNLLQIVKVVPHQDDRGFMGVCEFYSQVGFEAKRFYYITDVTKESVRGMHAHKELAQIYVCLFGNFTLTVNDGSESDSVVLNSKSQAVYVKPGLWREMLNFSPGAICLVIASHEYDKSDYIFDFLEFQRWANEKH